MESITEVVATALGSLAGLGAILAGGVVTYRKILGNGLTNNGEIVNLLKEIRDAVRDHNKDSYHRHEMTVVRLQEIEKELGHIRTEQGVSR